MIIVGELATLAMEIYIDKTGNFIFPWKIVHSIDSTNLTTIQTTLSNFDFEGQLQPKGQTTANAADAASSFVSEWEMTNAGNANKQAGSGYAGGSSPRSPSRTQQRNTLEETLAKSEECKLAELLDQWEGGDDRLERKKVRLFTFVKTNKCEIYHATVISPDSCMPYSNGR